MPFFDDIAHYATGNLWIECTFSTNVEKYTKNLQKGIDKEGVMCYNVQDVEERRQTII